MKRNILDSIDMKALGNELQRARTKRGLTQEEAAKIIDVARTTMTAIEKGERRIKADELVKLADAYGCDVSDFVRPRPQVEPFQLQFRSSSPRFAEEQAAFVPSLDTLEELCRNYLELEQITKAPLVRKYPSPYEVADTHVEQSAESIAIEERHRLGLGDGAVTTLRAILEQDVGLRIFSLPLPAWKCSALYLYDELLGGCIALNSEYAEEQQRWSLARAYAHFLTRRRQPMLFIEDRYQRLPEHERFLDQFALHFLIPTSGLTRHINDIVRTKEVIASADLSTLAHYYGVTVATMMLRLEQMKFLAPAVWPKPHSSIAKVREAQQQLTFETTPAKNEKLPARYQYLALDAFDNALITESQFARFLGTDLVEARYLAETLRQQKGTNSNHTRVNQTLG